MIDKKYIKIIKKVMGVVVGIVGVGIIFNIDEITDAILSGITKPIFGALLLVISYFLVMSGKQQ